MKNSMFRKLFFIFLSTSFFACTNPDEVPIPDSVLPKEKMAEVMVDIHLLEATLNIHAGSVNKIPSNNSLSAVNIYNKHGVTKEQFEESYEFYTRYPEHLAGVYQLVLNELSKMQAEVGNAK